MMAKNWQKIWEGISLKSDFRGFYRVAKEGIDFLRSSKTDFTSIGLTLFFIAEDSSQKHKFEFRINFKCLILIYIDPYSCWK